MDGDELRAWLRLGLTPGVGSLTGRRLLAAFGLPQQVFLQSTQALIEHTTADQAGALACVPEALDAQYRATTQWLETNGPHGEQRSIITLGDPRYPPALLQTEDPPLLLYALGSARFLQSHSFAALSALRWWAAATPRPRARKTPALSRRHCAAQAGPWCQGWLWGWTPPPMRGRPVCFEGQQQFPYYHRRGRNRIGRVYPRKNLELAHRIAQHGCC
jgi:DNA processing protein